MAKIPIKYEDSTRAQHKAHEHQQVNGQVSQKNYLRRHNTRNVLGVERGIVRLEERGIVGLEELTFVCMRVLIALHM